jgi:hypothetical protein
MGTLFTRIEGIACFRASSYIDRHHMQAGLSLHEHKQKGFLSRHTSVLLSAGDSGKGLWYGMNNSLWYLDSVVGGMQAFR